MVLLLSSAQKHNEVEEGIHSLGAFLPNNDVSLSKEQRSTSLCET